jgi:putative transposase
MDAAHALEAVRYVELNPVRAGLVTRAEDWEWSSARAHLKGEDDGLVRVQPILERVPDWAAFLGSAVNDNAESLRLHTSTGRPLGSDTFVDALEQQLGRSLRPAKGGRPRL